MDQLSTLDILEKISEQKHTTDTDIVQLIHIYYANYIESGDPAKKLSLKDAQDIYHICQGLMEDFKAFGQYASRTTSPDNQPSLPEIHQEFLSQLSPNIRHLWNFLYPVRYQMRMLGDIGATLLFVSDIVNRTLNGDQKDRFLGVDLGTGTGILLTAQDILARKHRYKKRELYGIEYDNDVAHKTRAFCQKLGYIISIGDTTKSSTWKRIPKGHIDCITNENIPAAHERMDREPFIDNMECIYEMRSDDISPETQFCPEKLEIIKDPTTCDQDIRYVASPENEFCTEEIGNDALAMEKNGLGDLMTLLIPYKITLEGKSIPLRLLSKLGAERLGNFAYKRGFMSRF